MTMTSLLLLFTLLGLVHYSAGDPRLVCPETVVARLGDDVTLSCRLEPEQNLEDETINCRRAASGRQVCALRNGEPLPDQADEYRRRAEFHYEGLKDGDVAVKLSAVTPSDNGTFQFYIRKWDISSTVTLVVEPADLQKRPETQNSSSAATPVEGAPPPSGAPPLSGAPPSGAPPSGAPPSGAPLGLLIGGPVAAVALVVIVCILVKLKIIQPCWTRRSRRGDGNQYVAAGNGHLDPEQPAEKQTMLELQ